MKKHLILSICFLSLIFCSKPRQEALVPEDYSGWKKLTNAELNYFVPGHEAHYRIPYINPTGEQVSITTDANGKRRYNYPEGTIILKEIYDGLNFEAGSRPISYTVMIKDKTSPAQLAGWVWIMKDAATGTETIFKGDMCINCHSDANEQHPYGDGNPDREFRDYLFYPWNPSGEIQATARPGRY